MIAQITLNSLTNGDSRSREYSKNTISTLVDDTLDSYQKAENKEKEMGEKANFQLESDRMRFYFGMQAEYYQVRMTLLTELFSMLDDMMTVSLGTNNASIKEFCTRIIAKISQVIYK